MRKGRMVEPVSTMSLCMRVAIESCLDDRSRRVIGQRYTQQLSYAEIAAEEGISETAVYKRIKKALDTLRKELIKTK